MITTFYWTWAILGIIIAALFAGIGTKIKGRMDGILIDERMKMSLSRFQVTLWSWLIISTFLAFGISQRSMDIKIPSEIWALMGISIGSAAGSVIVKGGKGQQEPATRVRSQVPRQGVLAVNTRAQEAGWADLFKAEEITNSEYVDISKVQMFFFSLAAVAGYAWAIASGTTDMLQKNTLPELSQSIVVLIGISHAGYLTVKAAPKTPTT